MMRRSLFVFGLSLVLSVPVFSRGGDRLRERAPVTALLLDLRDGNAGPLQKAYLEDEIDYFLDFQLPANDTIRELATLRQIGRSVAAQDLVEGQRLIRTVRRFKEQRNYLQAVVDGASGRLEQSLEGFRKLIDDRGNLSKRLQNLSFMGAARIFHEISDYKQAIYHYNQVRQLDSEFFQSVFEKSWSFYLDGDMNGALGATLTFLSPYFANAYYPEAYVVRAAAFYQLCAFDRAISSVEAFKREFEPIRIQLETLQRRDPSTWLFSDRSLRSIQKKILGGLTADTSFRTALRAYLALTQESKGLRGEDLAWNARALGQVKKRLEREASRVIPIMLADVTKFLAQADVIQIEVLQSGANVLLGAKDDDKPPTKILDLGAIDFDESVQFWPFQGEFWLDELGSYYYGLKSACPGAETSSNSKQSSRIAKNLIKKDFLKHVASSF